MYSTDLYSILPLIVLVAWACALLLIDLFIPKERKGLTALLAALGMLTSLVLAAFQTGQTYEAFSGMVVLDGFSSFLTILLLGSGIIGVALAYDYLRRMGIERGEYYILLMFSIVGMILMTMAADLIVVFIALELLSIPLYVLAGFAAPKPDSEEASLKYFLLGAFSSAFFLFGASFVYGYAGSMRFDEIAAAISSEIGMDGLLMPGLLLLATGLLFKVGAVPFHAWVPDVYQGAPTPVTGFMAAVTKVAAFGALLRVFYVAGESARLDWQPILAGVAAVTMIVGAVMSVGQNDVKRILAYSSIAHAGFILVGFLALDSAGVSGTMFYLAAYGFMTIPAFALVTVVRSSGTEATHVAQWSGLAKNHPWIAAGFSFLLLAFAGIPLTSGFTGKFAVFSAAIANNGAWLAVIGVLASAVTAYVYFRLILTMYFGEHNGDTVAVEASSLTTFAVAIGLLVTLGLGIMPSPMLELAQQASQFIR